MPRYVAMLRNGRVAVHADVQLQGHSSELQVLTVRLVSCAELDGSPEGFHPERLSIEERDEVGRQVRALASADEVKGVWS